MILSQPDLRKLVAEKKIIFDPGLEEDQWGEASVDLRLDFGFTILEASPGIKISVAQGLGSLGRAGFWKTITLKEKNDFGQRETITLSPKQLLLGMTYERIVVPPDLIAMVEGRSTYARVGLSMHETAPWIQPGWDGKIVLEMVNNGPLDIELTPLIDRPCQLSFLPLSSPLSDTQKYGARATDRYQLQKHPLKHEKKK
jgi:dCTP deaminase